MPTFSRSLEQSLHRALALANERHHENATLEHLLLALVDDEDALTNLDEGLVSAIGGSLGISGPCPGRLSARSISERPGGTLKEQRGDRRGRHVVADAGASDAA
jgi:hypothetical protein